jgi:hypothetical protein
MAGLVEALAELSGDRTLPFSFHGVDGEGREVVPETELQAWPESISFSMSVEYADKQILGGSHPVQQWVSSSGRSITFSFKMGRDQQTHDALKPGLLRALVTDPAGTKNNPDLKQVIDRMLTMVLPDYELEGAEVIAKAPPLAFIHAPGLGWALNLDNRDMLIGTIRSLNVAYTSVFPNGEPRLITADITVSECVQRPDRGVEFVGRSQLILSSPRYYNPR